MPFDEIESATERIRFSLISSLKAFHEFQPMGGVAANPLLSAEEPRAKAKLKAKTAIESQVLLFNLSSPGEIHWITNSWASGVFSDESPTYTMNFPGSMRQRC